MSGGIALAGGTNLPQDLVLCEGLLKFAGVYSLQNPRAQLFEHILGQRPLHRGLAVEFLAGHPALQNLRIDRLFSGSAGVKEGYSLRAHVEMVLTVFREQEGFYELSEEHRKLLEFAILFHDIGKPAAMEDFVLEHGREPLDSNEFKGISRRQLEFTLPILRQVMEVFAMTPSEQHFVEAIIGDDLMGSVVRDRVSPKEAYGLLTHSTAALGLPLKIFFDLRMLFYVSDAASYPGLRFGIERAQPPKRPVFFEEANGRLRPVSPCFRELADLVESLNPSEGF
jgi:hypothetical protein